MKNNDTNTHINTSIDDVIDASTKQDDYIAILKQHFPSVISQLDDGSYVVNKEQLQLMLEPKNCKLVDDGFGLNWVGKKEAYYNAYIQNNKILKPLVNQSRDFDNTSNILIKGDNLDALKLLRKNYFEKIKMIYIDPPYNTENDGFIYNDNFTKSQEQVLDELGYSTEQKEYIKNIAGAKTHSGWLSFMYPRLLLARDLLRDDGVIFISINDKEQANLKLLCDEVFGQENFVENVIIRKSTNGMGDKKGFSSNHEYILTYQKSCLTNFSGLKPTEEYVKSFNKSDNYGQYKIDGILRKKGEDSRREDSPTLFFPLFYNPDNGDVSLEEDQYCTHKILPIKSDSSEGRWTWGKEKIANDKHYLFASSSGTIYIKNYLTLNTRMKPKSIMIDSGYLTDRATNDFKLLFDNNKIFATPKPIVLIKHVIELSTGSNDIILDFFAGSGTTADAVMQLNAEDDGNRQFILVQLPEQIKKDNKKSQEAYNFVTKILQKEPSIFEITAERLRRAGDKIKSESQLLNQAYNLDLGFKVYEITDDTYHDIYKKPLQDVTQEELSGISNISQIDGITILTNLLLGSGITLNVKIAQIIADCLYKVDDHLFIIKEFALDHKYFIDIEYVTVYARHFTDDNFLANLSSYVNEDKLSIKG